MMMAPNLPLDVLVQLLSHVDQEQRLGSCALVCRSWHAAANAATTDIIYFSERGVSRSENLQAVTTLGAWLNKYGSNMTQCMLHLPESCWSTLNWLKLQPYQLTQLENLDIEGGEVALGACHGSSSQKYNDLTAMTALTRLRLSQVTIGFAAGSLQPLAALTNLQELALQDIFYTAVAPDDAGDGLRWAPNPWQDDRQGSRYVARHYAADCGDLSAAVGCLQQLTSLHIDFCFSGLPASGGFAPVSSLTNLVDLQLKHFKVSDDSLAELRSPLTKLELESMVIHFTRASIPGLVQLSQLQHLTLWRMSEFEPDILTNFTQLQHLEVEDCDALVPGDRQGTSALLAAVAQLQQLTSLRIECVQLAKVDDAEYAALVAPPQLRDLRLCSCGVGAVPITAAHHMFTGLTLLNLRTLLLSLVGPPVDQGLDYLETLQQVVEPVAACIEQVARWCTGLRDLRLESVWGSPHMLGAQLGMPFGGLSHGTALTRLKLGLDLAVNEATVVDVLCHMTQLKHLVINRTCKLTWPGVLQLTSLQQLTTLRLHDLKLPDSGYGSVDELHLENEAPADCPSDLGDQLQRMCVLHSQLCSALVQGQQVEREAREELQQQIAEKESELADMTAQLSAAQAQIQHLQHSQRPAGK